MFSNKATNSGINKFIKDNKFIASKKMGQNFLVDQTIVKKIIDNVPPLDEFDVILEIGPGLSSITKHLVTLNKPVIAVELDKRLYEYNKKTFADCKNILLINDDFLQLDIDTVLQPYKKVAVIANIPYSITSLIIIKCIKTIKIDYLYIMVQKEFSDRFDHKKNSNQNAFTAFVNNYYDYSYCFPISKNCFKPVPKVESSMIIFKRKNDKVYNQQFYHFLRLAFLMKRKKMLNNFTNPIDKQKMIDILNKMDIDLNIRSEQLDYQTLWNIFNLYQENNNGKN